MLKLDKSRRSMKNLDNKQFYNKHSTLTIQMNNTLIHTWRLHVVVMLGIVSTSVQMIYKQEILKDGLVAT